MLSMKKLSLCFYYFIKYTSRPCFAYSKLQNFKTPIKMYLYLETDLYVPYREKSNRKLIVSFARVTFKNRRTNEIIKTF